MKLTLCFVCWFLFSLHASVRAQEQMVTLKLEKISVAGAIQELKQQTRLDFFFSNKEVDVKKIVSLNCENMRIDEALQQLLGTAFQFEFVDQMVIIRPRITTGQLPQRVEMKISGRVRDMRGQPLPGVTVKIKETTLGVATDVEGKFELVIGEGIKTLVFSFVGMKTREIVAEAGEYLEVVMEEVENALEEVVCTGYQQVKKDRMTGAVEVIDAGELAGKPFVSVDRLLVGELAGVSTFMNSGQAGANADINIRGVNTLSGSTQPLWIVDGLPMQGDAPEVRGGASALESDILTNGVGNIAPADIKTITILKDAAAAAIYGARAANGVIVITTKRGVAGEFYCNYTGTVAWEMAPRLDLNFMNSEQKIQYETDLWNDWITDNRYYDTRQGRAGKILTDIRNGRISRETGQQQLDELRTYDTDWFKEIFRNSFTHTHNLSLSGGSEKLTYYASVNYADNQGILKSDKYENFNVNLKGTYQFHEKVSLTLGLTSTMRKKEYHHSSVDPFRYAVYANPYESPYDKQGNMRWDMSYINFSKNKTGDAYVFDRFNILNEMANTGMRSDYNSTVFSAELNYRIIEGLTFTSRVARTVTNKNDKQFAAPGTYTSFVQNWYRLLIQKDLPDDRNAGNIKRSALKTNQYSVNNSLDFSREFGNHYVSVFLGQEISAIKSENFFTWLPEYNPEMEIAGYPNIEDVTASSINLNRLGNIGYLEQRYSSFFASMTYGYEDRYILNLNGRLDGADIIGSDNQFTPLWSVSGRWNLHKNGFFRENKIVKELAVKAEYGYTGNINRNVYPFTTITVNGTNTMNGVLIASGATYPNSTVKWESKHEKSVGLILSLFDYRVNLSASYYHNKTKEVLNNKKLPSSTGIQSYYSNISNLVNKGVEVTLNLVPLRTENSRLGVGLNISTNKNVVSNSYYANMDAINVGLVLASQPIVDGYAVGAVFGVKDRGVNPATGERMVQAIRPVGLEPGEKPTMATEWAGDVVPRDKLYDHDRVYCLGQTTPKFYGGFNLNYSYKNLEITALFNFEGGHILPRFNERLSSPAGSNPVVYGRLNVAADRLYRWRQYGDISNYERYEMLQLDNYRTPMDSDYDKGDYLRCRSVAVNYRLPVEVLEKLPVKLQRVSLSLQLENLFTLTRYSGIDPELRRDFGYPLPKTCRFSLNVGF